MTTTINKPTRGARSAASPRRRGASKAEATEVPSGMGEEQERRETGPEMSVRTRGLARRALVPLTELYFVGIGALDWMAEKAMTIERDFAERGHRRNDALTRVASQMGAVVGEKTRALSKRGRERMEEMGEKVGEKMQRTRMRHGMPEAEPA